MTSEEETKAMSRLLTQGAKMLQKGCDDCGNPLFRYRGEVVCPVCNERRGAEAGEDGEKQEETAHEGKTEETQAVESTGTVDTQDAPGTSETSEERETQERDTDADVDEHLRVLAEKLARDAVEHADDPEAVERRLDALERTLALLR